MDDSSRVAALLGRTPTGSFEVVVRGPDGDPVVIANAPLLDDGTPMPTRYWLLGHDEVTAVSRLESTGGVRQAERDVDPTQLAAAHERYAAMRDALVPPEHEGPRPSGGVGGTRTGVKCLHAHYAWHLAGGDDPVGRWVARRLDGLELDIGPTTTSAHGRGVTVTLDVGAAQLHTEWLSDGDPPAPEQLTNALGDVADRLEELLLTHPKLTDTSDVTIRGPFARTIACVEVGADDAASPFSLQREAAEDVFRTLATERRADRAHNPGMLPEHVDTSVATCCIILAVMRRLHLDSVTIA